MSPSPNLFSKRPLPHLAASVKTFRISPALGGRYLLAITAGLLWAAAYPTVELAGFAWSAPALLAAAAAGASGAHAFRAGYLAGLTFYLTTLYWLLLIPVRGLPILGWLALAGYLALYPAAWTWAITRMAPRLRGRRPPGEVETGLLGGLRQMTAWSWGHRQWWALFGALAWVAGEMIMARLLTGFPWNLLGVSQYRLLPLIQIAAVTGVYGVSFLIAWTSLSLLSAAVVVVTRPQPRSGWVAEIALPLVAVAATFAHGLRVLREPRPATGTLRVVMVQPSIPQTLIWNPAEDETRFTRLVTLTTTALSQPADLVLWPEAGVPQMPRHAPATAAAIRQLAREHRVWLIVGADDADRRPDDRGHEHVDFWNASFLVTPEGDLAARYCKRRLVIFGEYVPLVRWLPFLRYFTPITGSFTPGDRVVPFELVLTNAVAGDSPAAGAAAFPGNRRVRTATLICFEDIFPHGARAYLDDDTDFLVNLTNNGWFGESAAQWQHAANATFRAIENGVPLLRCANNGWTGWVDAHGRVRQVFTDAQGRIYGEGFLLATIPLPDPTKRPVPTYYRRHGDRFGWGCVVLAGLGLMLTRIRLSV